MYFKYFHRLNGKYIRSRHIISGIQDSERFELSKNMKNTQNMKNI